MKIKSFFYLEFEIHAAIKNSSIQKKKLYLVQFNRASPSTNGEVDDDRVGKPVLGVA